MILFFLIGIGTKSYGQAAGDYVFAPTAPVPPALIDSLWATVGNWSISDGAGNLTLATRTPGATDNVWIPAGKRMGTVAATSTATGAIVVGSTTVTLAAAPSANIVGLAIRNKATNGANYGFAPGTYVTAVSGTSVTISQPTTSTNVATNLEFYPSCKNLIVDGFMRVSAQLVVFGDLTVHVGGIFTQASDLYCANINNYGTFNANTNFRSAKNLYFGFNGAVPGTGDYTITNDGTFGDTQAIVPAGVGSGIKVLYSNMANSITIKSSSSSVTGYKFNIAQIIPSSNMKTLANTNLNIKENMSLLIHNGIGLSIQNADTCVGATKTCTIDPGVTVYVGYRLHAGETPTTNDQGSFVYNINGTLDFATYASASNNLTAASANTTQLNLIMSSVSGNSGSLTLNLGDGTQTNAGTLILGSNVRLVKQRTQSININFKDYSNVRFKGNYGWNTNFWLLNSNTPAPYLFPTKFYNLSIDSAKYVLPAKSIVRGTYTAPTGRAAFTNWVAATIGGVTPTTLASSLYNGTTLASLPQGSIMFTGSAYYYVPVVRSTSTYMTNNPIVLNADTTLNYLMVGQYANGSSIANVAVSAISGTSVTLASAPTATTTQTNAIVQFLGIQGTVAPTAITSPVFDGTQALIYLGGADFINPVMAPNAVNSPSKNNVLVYSDQTNRIAISNATVGDIVTVYSVSGMKVASAKLTSDKTTVNVGSGIYLVKVNNSVSKVVVR